MKRIFVFFTVLCIAVGSLAGCGKDEQVVAKDQLVKTQKVRLGDNGESGSYSGTVRGRYETNMAFQVGGRILNRNVQLGDRVKAGDVLMSIDSRDVVQQSNQGDAQAAAAKSQLDLAQNNLNRYRQLYAQEAVPAMVLDQYQASYDAALSAYNQAVAQASLGHNAMGYTSLVAGSDGVISSISAESGQVVGAGQTVLTLIQSSELEVEINVPESHLQDVSVGKQVEVSFWALQGVTCQGVIREVAPMADSVAKTYKVRVTVVNPPADMKLGMTANVRCSEVAAAGTNSSDVMLPLSAIYQSGDDTQVWVVDPEALTISLVKVRVERLGNNQVKVSGLQNGAIVVTAGVHMLREGTKVRLSEDEQ